MAAGGSPGSVSLPGQGSLAEEPVSETSRFVAPLARRGVSSAGSAADASAAAGPSTPTPGSGPGPGTAGSPWQYQLNPRVRGRGLEASPSPALGVRALSGTRTVVNAAARASYESAVLAAVRRQIEAFEEKVENQISKLQVQGDKSKDTSLSRLEEKVSAAEGLQPRVERRLAELSGNFKGLSDEMQAQIRRVDLLDDRRWEWRHQVEEEMQKKCQGHTPSSKVRCPRSVMSVLLLQATSSRCRPSPPSCAATSRWRTMLWDGVQNREPYRPVQTLVCPRTRSSSTTSACRGPSE